MRRTPVRHHIAFKVDGLFEIALQRARVLATPVPVDLVVAAHHGANTCFDSSLERRIIDLKSSSLIHLLADASTICFLVVLNEVLGIGHNLLGLNPFYHRLHKPVPQVWIFTRQVLEIPAIQGHPCHIQSRPKLEIRPLVIELLAHALTPLKGSFFVPGRGDGQARRPGRGSPCQACWRAESLRSIVHVHRRHPQAFHWSNIADIGTSRIIHAFGSSIFRPMQHLQLFGQSHVGNQQVSSFMSAQRWI
mmetsp:Transcript_59210/g.141072  ORF Transcript_59210/g.141072 Transcript_59210/m.141072 type:complete len:248 (+) Transcript_59210:1554-2297(+)